MKKFNYPLFCFLLLTGVLMTIFSSSWFSAWLGLELNLLGFLPLLIQSYNSSCYEMIVKYFLISSISSLVIIYFALFSNNPWEFLQVSVNSLLINLALILKLGSAPFHFWFISFMNNISLTNGFFLMTLQKIPSLFLISLNSTLIIYLLCLLACSWVGSIGGLHQTSNMKILGYSSISHLSWILTAMFLTNQVWMLYFLSYCFMLFPIFMYMHSFSFLYLSDLLNLSKNHMIIFVLSLLSLGGLPPLFGFFPKLFILIILVQKNQYFISFTLIFSSIFSLYFYLRLSYMYFLVYNTMEPKFNLKSKLSLPMLMFCVSPLIFCFI